MDATSFVLGVQSRALRSTNLKELIFRPNTAHSSSALSKAGNKQLKASATLVYTHVRTHKRPRTNYNRRDDDDDDDDNEEESSENSESEEDEVVEQQQRVEGVEEDEPEDGQEFRSSRTISASGVGEHQVNGKTCSFAQYERTLKRIGVLVKARNFLVFQGDVEAVCACFLNLDCVSVSSFSTNKN